MAPQLAGSIGPIADSDEGFEDWIFRIARWWNRIHPRELEVDVFRPNDPAGLGTTSGAFF